MSIKQVTLTFLILIFLSAVVSPLYAWETPIELAGHPNHEYHKPEIVFGPSGAVYAVYRDRNNITNDSDIMLCKWDGKELVYDNVSDLGKVWDKFDAEESDIVVDQDEVVHVAWIGADRNAIETRHIMYRYKQGDTWSEIFYLGELDLPSELQYMIDTRLAVDSMGNAHVVTCIDAEPAPEADQGTGESLNPPAYGGTKTSWYVAKYGDTVTTLYQLFGNNAKHPDVVVTDDYVHITWMYKTGWPYWIFVQKWENKPDAVKGPVITVTNPAQPFSSQKSRIDVDDEGKMHIVEFYKTEDVKKMRYFTEQSDGSFSSGGIVSQNQFLLYHKADLRVRPNSVLVTMQRGQSAGNVNSGVWFNWQRNGQWGNCTLVPGTEFAVYPSNDLSLDGETAVIAWSKQDSQIMMTSSAPITATGTLDVQFSQPDTVFWGSEITFDASQCVALNPDHNILQYTWDFGDGNIVTTSGSTIAYTYGLYNTTVPVKLGLTAENGDVGEISKEIYIDALYSGTITAINGKRIRSLFFNRQAYEIFWDDNPLNAANNYPAISRYEIWRARQNGAITDSSYTKVGEVTAGRNKFLDYFGLEDGVNYVYSIRSVDVEGHISPFNNVSATSAKKPSDVGLNRKIQ
ncbi:MAG: PKD domain-containing protein [bacterium]|nr:PKD domain-containing protein [bacterium]